MWRLVIAPIPKQGTFRISKTINGSVVWSSPINVQGLNSSSIGSATGLNVSAISDYEYELSQSQILPDPTVNVSAIGSDASGLIAYSSKYGVLNLNSLDVELLLNGAASASAVLEIDVELDGRRQTLAQNAVTILNNLIDTDAYTLVEWGALIPAQSVVRFDTPQTLSSGEQTQARANIGAVGTTSLTPYTTKDNELESRIASLEGLGLTSTQQAAITGANSPSGSNVFSTATDLAGKANASHTHTISNVTGLQSALDNKSDVGHSHAIADVTGLQTALDNIDSAKANTVHTHTMSDISGLAAALASKSDLSHTHATLPNTDQKDALNNADTPTASNPLVTVSKLEDYVHSSVFTPNSMGLSGTLTTTNYPYEIAIVVNGVTYKIPARLV